jgi:hypothetical protein
MTLPRDAILINAPRHSNYRLYRINVKSLICLPDLSACTLLIASLKNQNKAITATNLLQAAAALRDSIDWEVAPPAKKDVQMSKDTSRKNHAKPADDNFGNHNEGTIMRDASAKMDHENGKQVVNECKSLIDSHKSYPHSRTYKQREELQKTFDRLLAQIPNPTKQQADNILAALKDQQAKFPE